VIVAVCFVCLTQHVELPTDLLYLRTDMRAEGQTNGVQCKMAA